MRISIFGLGYVGAVSAACLARDGHQVTGIDPNPDKLKIIRNGCSPIVEEGIQELTRKVVESGRFTVSDDPHAGVLASDLSFVCVGTPSLSNGGQNLDAVRKVSEDIGTALAKKQEYHVVIIRSTIEPGTIDQVVKPILESSSGKKVGKDFGLGFQPEFLREGTSIKDYDNPPFTVVGTDSERSADVVASLFRHLPCEFIATDIKTAEALKYACNIFHALKIVFANEIGRFSKSMGIDGREVMRLICKDKQLNISSAYLSPGFAYGGSCLPKDLRALLYMAKNRDVSLPMLQGIAPSNQLHIDNVVDYVLAAGSRRVGMIGLSFKSGTDDLRESPLVTVAERFIGKGIDLKIHDPNVRLSHLIGANRRYIEESIPHIASTMTDTCDELIDNVDIVVVGLRDAALLEKLYERNRADQLIVDLVSITERDRIKGKYWGICW